MSTIKGNISIFLVTQKNDKLFFKVILLKVINGKFLSDTECSGWYGKVWHRHEGCQLRFQFAKYYAIILSRQQTEHFLCSINLLVHFQRGRAYSSQGKSTLPSPLLVAALLKIKIKTKIKSLMQSFFSCRTIIPLPKKWLLFEPHFFPNFGQSQLCSIFRNYFTPNYSFNYTVKS